VPTVTTRVERYFGFVDLCGFSDFTDSHGDDAAADALHALRQEVRDAATDAGIRVAKWLGDGAMLVGVEAGPLLDAVAACNRSRALPSLILPLRAGVAGGPVIVFEGDDYVGRPVNLAAKLCALADPSKALVHQALAERLPASLTVLATTRRSVPGFAEPIDLLEVALPSTAPLGAGQLDA